MPKLARDFRSTQSTLKKKHEVLYFFAEKEQTWRSAFERYSLFTEYLPAAPEISHNKRSERERGGAVAVLEVCLWLVYLFLMKCHGRCYWAINYNVRGGGGVFDFCGRLFLVFILSFLSFLSLFFVRFCWVVRAGGGGGRRWRRPGTDQAGKEATTKAGKQAVCSFFCSLFLNTVLIYILILFLACYVFTVRARTHRDRDKRASDFLYHSCKRRRRRDASRGCCMSLLLSYYGTVGHSREKGRS